MRKLLIMFFMMFMVLGFLSFTGSAMPSTEAPLGDDYDFRVTETNSTDSEDDPEDGEDEEEEKEEEDEDSDDDGVDDDKEKAYEREIEMEIDEEKFKIKSTLKNETNKDEFELEFDVGSDDNAEIKLKFQSEAGSLESELEYEVKFDEIIEFIDEYAPGYDNETILTEYEIGKAGWAPLSYSENVTSGLININATTLDGVFSLLMRISNSFLVDENVTISPTSLKIDVVINNFDYNTTGSKLAVKSHMKTEVEMEVDEESEDELEGTATNETEIELSTGTSAAFFSWSDVAMADGQLIDVIASSLSDSSDEEGEVSSKMYYTFNATDVDEVVWDPKVGVVSTASKANVPVDPVVDDPVDTPVDNDVTPTPTAPVEDTEAFSLPGFELWAALSIFAFAFMYKRRTT